MKLIWGTVAFLFLAGGCSYKDSYFGVKNRAIIVPKEFGETEAAIEKAEKSARAKSCPEKIARAKKMARRGVEIYWEELCLGCRDQKSMAFLAMARKLAHEVESSLPLPTPPRPEPTPTIRMAIPSAPPAPAPIVRRPIPTAPPEPTPIVRMPIPTALPEPTPIILEPIATPPPAPAPIIQIPIPTRLKPTPLVQETTWEPKVIILDGVNFAFDSFNLTLKARAILDEQVAILKERSEIKVEVGGHTDSIGTISYNQALSERRAKAVKMCLISKGSSRDQLKAVGYGESCPIAPNDTKEGRAKNRRVELKVIETSSSSESYDLVEDMRKTKIKVLSGDGNLDSAKEMANMLRNMGYKTEFIDHASSSSFRRNTVFFAPKFQYEAKRLVSSLGGNTIVRPLSWYSIFDLIIVTGKNP